VITFREGQRVYARFRDYGGDPSGLPVKRCGVVVGSTNVDGYVPVMFDVSAPVVTMVWDFMLFEEQTHVNWRGSCD